MFARARNLSRRLASRGEIVKTRQRRRKKNKEHKFAGIFSPLFLLASQFVDLNALNYLLRDARFD